MSMLVLHVGLNASDSVGNVIAFLSFELAYVSIGVESPKYDATRALA